MNYITEIEKLVPIPEFFKTPSADLEENASLSDYEGLRQIIEDAGMDVVKNVQKFNPEDLNLFTRKVWIKDGDINGISLPTGIVQFVENKGKTCIEIEPTMKNMAKDITSLSYASDEYPVFYKENKRLYVLPVPTQAGDSYFVIFSEGNYLYDTNGVNTGVKSTYIQFSTSLQDFNSDYIQNHIDHLPNEDHFKPNQTGTIMIDQGTSGLFPAIKDVKFNYRSINSTTLEISMPFFLITTNSSVFTSATYNGKVYYRVTDNSFMPQFHNAVAYVVDRPSTTLYNENSYTFDPEVINYGNETTTTNDITTNDNDIDVTGITIGTDNEGNILVDNTAVIIDSAGQNTGIIPSGAIN